eukprot:359351-Chlamydomonas_euryale.AAC.3
MCNVVWEEDFLADGVSCLGRRARAEGHAPWSGQRPSLPTPTTHVCARPATLQANPGLRHLSLSRCHLSTAGARALAYELGLENMTYEPSCSWLETLDVSYNPLGEAGVHNLVEALQVWGGERKGVRDCGVACQLQPAGRGGRTQPGGGAAGVGEEEGRSGERGVHIPAEAQERGRGGEDKDRDCRKRRGGLQEGERMTAGRGAGKGGGEERAGARLQVRRVGGEQGLKGGGQRDCAAGGATGEGEGAAAGREQGQGQGQAGCAAGTDPRLRCASSSHGPRIHVIRTYGAARLRCRDTRDCALPRWQRSTLRAPASTRCCSSLSTTSEAGCGGCCSWAVGCVGGLIMNGTRYCNSLGTTSEAGCGGCCS